MFPPLSMLSTYNPTPKNMKKIKIQRRTIKQTLLEMSVGEEAMLSAMVNSKESIRVICSQLKKENGAVFIVNTHDITNYSVKRIS